MNGRLRLLKLFSFVFIFFMNGRLCLCFVKFIFFLFDCFFFNEWMIGFVRYIFFFVFFYEWMIGFVFC